MKKFIIDLLHKSKIVEGFLGETKPSTAVYINVHEERRRVSTTKSSTRLTYVASLILYLLFAHDCLASEPQAWQMLLQTPATHLMEELQEFHNFLLLISGGIVAFIIILLIYVCIRFNAKANPIPAKFSDNILVEIIWTIIPIVILIIIAVPSFRVARIAEDIPEIDMTVKVVGYQWYWHYIYPDHNNLEFDSCLITDENLKPGQKRLLEVDNRIIIPENTTVKFLITAGDVIHSFAVPALGIKLDAVPGRVNETWTKISKKGVYYGQCSELCGVNHGFMPIAIEVVSKEEFQDWLIAAKTKFSMKVKTNVIAMKP
ncbi:MULTISPECIES: cytochrome c oxidase subunit II [Rickettsieae]|uniref:cytochrome c oxidase subunit II n=1 Tax=Rickettsieae TaxID=33988 RepID=UPI000B9B8CEA|nr:cytochrome c oxidase subunit II [Rickettsia endosymbiont of Culicoides newsteadi]OZG32056.1 cytochrome c oxidase subunit II [Rickettsia endosymbiont of Culicoides newsteadi]